MLRIYGASDDLVYIEGDLPDGSQCEEIGCFERPVEIEIGGKLLVTARYCAERAYSEPKIAGVWSLQVEQVEEGDEIPWNVYVKTRDPLNPATPAYSVALVIDCPRETTVEWRDGRDAEDDDDE